ncbi:MAG TPA: hypothetical protein VK015_04885 [Microbacterium sp.]|nr:hypothetical protein [Microbacterium sp.]
MADTLRRTRVHDAEGDRSPRGGSGPVSGRRLLASLGVGLAFVAALFAADAFLPQLAVVLEREHVAPRQRGPDRDAHQNPPSLSSS